jgi:hypothetical protein
VGVTGAQTGGGYGGFHGSLNQQLLLNRPVPVLAVKLPEGELPSSSFDRLPAGMRHVPR